MGPRREEMEIDRLPCSLKVFGSFSFPHTLFIGHKSITWIVQLWDHHLSHILIQNSLWKLSISCIKWSYLKFFPGAKHVNYVSLRKLLTSYRLQICTVWMVFLCDYYQLLYFENLFSSWYLFSVPPLWFASCKIILLLAL